MIHNIQKKIYLLIFRRFSFIYQISYICTDSIFQVPRYVLNYLNFIFL